MRRSGRLDLARSILDMLMNSKSGPDGHDHSYPVHVSPAFSVPCTLALSWSEHIETHRCSLRTSFVPFRKVEETTLNQMHANLVIAKKAAAAVAAAKAKARKEEAKRKSKTNGVENKTRTGVAVPQATHLNPSGAEEMGEEERGGGKGDARGAGGDDQRGSA